MNRPLKISSKRLSPNTGGYRYFFNGQEGDNEVFGEVANFGYEFRQYDSRLGRWWSVDPKWNCKHPLFEYPGVSPYVFCNGNPINRVDPKGSADDWIYNLKTNRYTWDSNVTSPENTPEGYEYVGQTKQDISNHFKQHNPVSFIFRNPQFEENRTPYNGEISTPKLTSMVEIWLSSPSANIGQGIVKAVSNFAYSILKYAYSKKT
jgi:RHS repeat-associated protein